MNPATLPHVSMPSRKSILSIGHKKRGPPKRAALHGTERPKSQSRFTRKLRKATGSLWPAKPMKPVLRSTPAGLVLTPL